MFQRKKKNFFDYSKTITLTTVWILKVRRRSLTIFNQIRTYGTFTFVYRFYKKWESLWKVSRCRKESIVQEELHSEIHKWFTIISWNRVLNIDNHVVYFYFTTTRSYWLFSAYNNIFLISQHKRTEIAARTPSLSCLVLKIRKIITLYTYMVSQTTRTIALYNE